MIVCVCNAIMEKDVREAARKGARTPEAAYGTLGCEPQCGCCLNYAQEIIDDERGKRPQLRAVARLDALAPAAHPPPATRRRRA